MCACARITVKRHRKWNKELKTDSGKTESTSGSEPRTFQQFASYNNECVVKLVPLPLRCWQHGGPVSVYVEVAKALVVMGHFLWWHQRGSAGSTPCPPAWCFHIISAIHLLSPEPRLHTLCFRVLAWSEAYSSSLHLTMIFINSPVYYWTLYRTKKSHMLKHPVLRSERGISPKPGAVKSFSAQILRLLN